MLQAVECTSRHPQKPHPLEHAAPVLHPRQQPLARYTEAAVRASSEAEALRRPEAEGQTRPQLQEAAGAASAAAWQPRLHAGREEEVVAFPLPRSGNLELSFQHHSSDRETVTIGLSNRLESVAHFRPFIWRLVPTLSKAFRDDYGDTQLELLSRLS